MECSPNEFVDTEFSFYGSCMAAMSKRNKNLLENQSHKLDVDLLMKVLESKCFAIREHWAANMVSFIGIWILTEPVFLKNQLNRFCIVSVTSVFQIHLTITVYNSIKLLHDAASVKREWFSNEIAKKITTHFNLCNMLHCPWSVPVNICSKQFVVNININWIQPVSSANNRINGVFFNSSCVSHSVNIYTNKIHISKHNDYDCLMRLIMYTIDFNVRVT